MSKSFRSNINRCDDFVAPENESEQTKETRTIVIAPIKVIEQAPAAPSVGQIVETVTLISYACNYTQSCRNRQCGYSRRSRER